MATYIVKCFGSMADCFYGTGEWRPPQPIPASIPIPDVILDTSTMGKLIFDSFILCQILEIEGDFCSKMGLCLHY